MINEKNASIKLTSGIKHGIVGHIVALSGGGPPENWALCDGSECTVDEYPALFAAIGARFGGNGVTTFELPDLAGAGRFAICLDGYFFLEGAPPSEWKLARQDDEYIRMRVLSLVQSYAQGRDPFHQHTRASELDPEWLEKQVQVLRDGYAQSRDPLHRHQHVSELDAEWLERQARVLQDGYAQGRDPLHRHRHESELDAEWLEQQAQVLTDAYAQGRDPLHRHRHVSELDPQWLERQAQVFKDAYAQGHDPHHRHPHVSHIQEELDQRVEEMIAAYARGENPLVAPAAGETMPDDLKRIEGIGPKTAALLQEAGVTTFAQLAGTNVQDLEAVLDGAGNWPSDPSTWPEQAALAAAGKWDALVLLQQELKGGRRTKDAR